MRAAYEAESQEKVAGLRSTLDDLHSQILALQKQMADCWIAFLAKRQKGEAAVTAEVTDLEKRIHVLNQENSKVASFLAPIRRLPVEMLAEIFTTSIACHAHSRLELMRACRSWRAMVLTMPCIRSDIRLCTWTKADKIDFILERTGVNPLDVEVDTSVEMLKMVDTTAFSQYAGLELAAKTAKRWRSLTVKAFPNQLDIDAHSTPEKPAFVFSGPMDDLQSFKIKTICEDSAVFNQLIDVVGNSSHHKLTDMELSSPNSIYMLSQPQFASVFRRLVTFKVDVREMRTEVDILAQFEHLETLEAHRLRLPHYHTDVDLPLVRTLKWMKIKTVSVQWMAGRTFPNMEDCTIIWPHYPESLGPGGGVDLPACTRFTYDDHIIDTLPNFRIPKLDKLIVLNEAWNKKLIVLNEAWNKPRGSTQLAAVWNGAAGQVAPLKSRVLHLDTQCYEQHLINALTMLPELEELHLGVVRPDGLGKKFFCALQAKKGRSSRSVMSATHTSPFYPLLKTFGIRYRRWIREDETTPPLRQFVESRQKTDTPLQSLKFWPTKETAEDAAEDLRKPVMEAGGEWDWGGGDREKRRPRSIPSLLLTLSLSKVPYLISLPFVFHDFGRTGLAPVPISNFSRVACTV